MRKPSCAVILAVPKLTLNKQSSIIEENQQGMRIISAGVSVLLNHDSCELLN